MDDDEFLYRFENAGLPRQEWNHAAHIRMAYLYLKDSDSWEAVLPLVRERIRWFNAAHRSYTGYHETITAAFLRLVYDRLNRSGEVKATSFKAFCEDHPDLLDGMSVLLRHYEKETLFSPEARADFVEPDREALP
jgi:hypothetical protein